MPYYWRGSGPLRRGSERIRPGESFEPSDAELSAFSDLIEESEDADEPDDEVAEEFDDEYPVRVESYVNRGKCGHFDPDEMDDPCARAAGWGIEGADDGPCKDHYEE